ncbi:MAG: SBBP repeat-containing protein [Chloroflexi bacterium]|nr:SBBP repeat-containing protein [Chloroflexota bacterium]
MAKVNASGTALVYAGYIGGNNYESGYGIAVDSAGNAYVTGNTYSTEATFPVTIGPDLTHNGSSDAFVAKVDASGTALVYAGYIGGSGGENGYGIAVDTAGNAYVMGDTYSTEATFPETMGPDLIYNGGGDAFAAKVNASGTELVYAGYIGGSDTDYGIGIAVDAAGNAYVTGYTSSTEATFPETVGPDLTHNGGWDAFVAKVNASGSALVYAGYIGGSDYDNSYGIAVDTAGNAYVTGNTWSTEATFPVAVGPDVTYNGIGDAFVAKVNASGSALVYAGYIGGSGDDYGRGIAVDSAGNAYVTGFTASTEATFPVTIGPDLTHNGGIRDAFVAKVRSMRQQSPLLYHHRRRAQCGDGQWECGRACWHLQRKCLTRFGRQPDLARRDDAQRQPDPLRRNVQRAEREHLLAHGQSHEQRRDAQSQLWHGDLQRQRRAKPGRQRCYHLQQPDRQQRRDVGGNRLGG